MKFEEVYEITLGIPDGKLPSFKYQYLNDFGIFTEPRFGSIRPRVSFHSYCPEVLAQALGAYLAEREGIEDTPHVAVILDKGTTVDAVRDYIMGALENVTIDTGVMLCLHGSGAGLRTLSAYHRPAHDDEVFKFAGEIEKLRKLQITEMQVLDPSINVGQWSGDIPVGLNALVEKYPHRFGAVIASDVEADDEDSESTIEDYVEQIRTFEKSSLLHLRQLRWEGKRCEVTLGNSTIIFTQRPKSIKAEVYTENLVNGAETYNVATSDRTIRNMLAETLCHEEACAQTGRGHYDTSRLIQYDAKRLITWLTGLATKHDIRFMKHEDGETFEIMWHDFTPAVIMRCTRIHAEIEFNFENGCARERIHVFHSTCELGAKFSIEQYLKDEVRKARFED